MAPEGTSAVKLHRRRPLPRCERMGVEGGDTWRGEEGGRDRQAVGDPREGTTSLTAHGNVIGKRLFNKGRSAGWEGGCVRRRSRF